MYIAKRQMWTLPVIAFAVVLAVAALFGFSSVVNAQTWPAQDLPGEYCVEGLVIDWEEETMAGIEVTLKPPAGPWLTDITDDGDDEGEFKFESGDPDDLEPDEFAPSPGPFEISARLPGPDWENVTQNPITFSIDPNLDDCVQIRFKFRRIVPVTVYKIDSDHNGLGNWTIDAIPGGGNLFAEPQSEDTLTFEEAKDLGDPSLEGRAQFSLTPGVWIFMERQPDSDEDGIRPDPFQPVVPRSGRMEIDVQPTTPDKPYILVFKNEFKDNGCISVRKYGQCTTENAESAVGGACGNIVDPNHPEWGYGVAGWEFTLERSDGTVARVGTTNAEGIVNFTNLPFGPYTIIEEERGGWDNVSQTAVKVEVTSSDSCVQVPFQNVQADTGYCIEGYKRDVNGGYGLPNWKIETDPVDDGGYEPDDVYTDGLGKFRIDFPANDYRIPGSEFEVCEDEDEMDGWLPRTPTCQIVKLPIQPGKCVQALDFVNEQVGHSQSEKMQAKQDAMAEHLQSSAGDLHEPMGKPGDMDKPGDRDGGAMWGDGSDGMYCANYHVVRPGDGLFDIGFDNDKTPQQMVDANPDVKGPNYVLYVGQKVCIP